MLSASKLSSLIAISVVLLSQSAFAQTSKSGDPSPPSVQPGSVADTVTKWGLTGAWSGDCSAPIDDSHDRQTFQIDPSGQVFHEHNFGSRTVRYEVVSAAVSEVGSLGIQEVVGPHRREFGYLKQTADSVRVMYNRDENNEYSVKEGVLVANGRPTTALNRCN